MSHENSFVISVDLDEYKLHPKFGESITSASRRYNNNHHNHFTPRSPCKSNILEHLSLRNRESIRCNGYIPPKTNDSTLNELPESFADSFKEEYDDEDDDERVPFSKWKQLSLVINSVCRLKNAEVVSIKSIGDLKTSLYDTGSCLSPGLGPHSLRGDIMYITSGQLSRQAMCDARDQSHFFKAIERGNSMDCDYIKERLQKDPKKFIYSSDDSSCLTNKQDHRGYTPLYVACRNGNMKMVKLLLEFKANPYLYSQVTKTEKESILFVTARWGHVDLIELLTGHGFAWSKKEFYEAYKTASNKQIKDILKKKMATLEKGSRVSRLIGSRH